DQGVRLRDVNGDGLVDFIYSKGIDRKTYINTGQGWLENSSYKLNEPIVNDTFEDQGVRFLDVNGDGLLDYVRGEQMYKKVYLNTGSGWRLSSSFVLPQPIVSNYSYTVGFVEQWWWVSKDGVVSRKPSGMHFAELNGDGLIDIVYGRDNDKKAYLNNGSNWVESSNLAIPINITNSITERIGRRVGSNFVGYKQMGVRIVDINNDGLDDIIKASGDVTATYINQGNSWKLSNNYALPKPIQTSVYIDNSPVKLLDINGDGLVDMLYGKGNSRSVYLNTGNGWSSTHNFTLPESILTSGNEDTGIRFVDINSDGLIDVLEGIHTTKKVHLNTGSSWVRSYKHQTPAITAKNNHKNAGTRFVDLNGDGLVDVITSRPDNIVTFINQRKQATKLTSITNGFGIQTTLNYKPLTDLSIYTKGSNKGHYPNISIQNARQVISSVTTDNAIGGQNTTTYKYGNAKVNVKGRGNLGFGWIEKKDLQSNKLTR
ncbi:hypothetical protein BSPLISOX_2012, partial [uncultured Gammaproteobacteria bacterium]